MPPCARLAPTRDAAVKNGVAAARGGLPLQRRAQRQRGDVACAMSCPKIWQDKSQHIDGVQCAPSASFLADENHHSASGSGGERAPFDGPWPALRARTPPRPVGSAWCVPRRANDAARSSPFITPLQLRSGLSVATPNAVGANLAAQRRWRPAAPPRGRFGP